MAIVVQALATERKWQMTRQSDFSHSEEAAFRRRVRDAIRLAKFTKFERDIILALVNHWFEKRNRDGGVIHPGRQKLAKKAGGVSIKTVSRCLNALRQEGVLGVHGHLDGKGGKATEYSLAIHKLTALCMKPDPLKSRARVGPLVPGPVIGGTNGPGSGRDLWSHRNNSVVPFKPLPKGKAS